MSSVENLRSLLQRHATVPKERCTFFFKTGKGHYAEHDQFMGITVPVLRKVAKQFSELPLNSVKALMTSPFNEERLIALLILIQQYQKANPILQEQIYLFYLRHLKHVNNWNLVDTSAAALMGAYLWNNSKNILLTLARSKNLWERRIAIIATWYFIRQQKLHWTFKIARLLLKDPHDLIHKAVGWMLREAGKRDQKRLMSFLKRYHTKMPRTMLRYSIEKFPPQIRAGYLRTKTASS